MVLPNDFTWDEIKRLLVALGYILGNSRITVGDYAKAMVDELETPVHHQERFTIGY